MTIYSEEQMEEDVQETEEWERELQIDEDEKETQEWEREKEEDDSGE